MEEAGGWRQSGGRSGCRWAAACGGGGAAVRGAWAAPCYNAAMPAAPSAGAGGGRVGGRR